MSINTQQKRKLLVHLAAVGILAATSLYSLPGYAVKEVTAADGRVSLIAEPGDTVPGEVIVKLRTGATVKDAEGLAARLGGRISGYIQEYNLVLIITNDGKLNRQAAVTQAVQAAKQDAKVEDAFPNIRFSIPKPPGKQKILKQSTRAGDGVATPEAGIQAAAAPTGNQWHLRMINWTDAGTPPAVTDLVAVVDTGVDYNHPDLAGNILRGHDYVDDDFDPMDEEGHGTHVAGIIAARGTYSAIGVSPTTKILAVRVLDSYGSGSWFDIMQGVIHARNYPGVRAINLSLGGYMKEGSPEYNLMKKVSDDTLAMGIVPVVAAGNEANFDLYYYQSTSKYRPVPAWFPSCLTVGASQEVDMRTYFSNYDIGTLDGKVFNYNFVDIVAPGWQILSTVPGGGYERMSGTSMAAPIVAGAVARYWANHPNQTPTEVIAALQNSGRSVNVYQGFPTAEKRLDLMKALGIDQTGFVGVVYNGQTGITFPGVSVIAKSGDRTVATATTDQAGFFRLKGLTGGVTYAINYARSGYSTPSVNTTAVSGQLVPYVKPIFMNQTRPAGQWSVLIDWRSWHVGSDEADWTYPSKPTWSPYNWNTMAGTFFSPYLKSSSGYLVGEADFENERPYMGSLTEAPYMAMTHYSQQTKRPGDAFVIKPQSGVTYQVYTQLDNINSDYYEWGRYKTTTNVTDPRVQARLYLGPVLKATVNANSATGSGTYWHIATVKGTTVYVVNKLQNTAP
jgi:thermitase